MTTTMWATLREDGLKPPFSSGKEVSTFTVMLSDLDKRTTESVANSAMIETSTHERGRRGKECQSTSGSKPSHIW